MNYRSIVEQVIKKYFPNINFNCIGKLEWYPVTEKEKKESAKNKMSTSGTDHNAKRMPNVPSTSPGLYTNVDECTPL